MTEGNKKETKIRIKQRPETKNMFTNMKYIHTEREREFS